MLNLIPMPKKIKIGSGKVSLSEFDNLNLPSGCSHSLLELAVKLANELESTVGNRIRFVRSEVAGASIRLLLNGSEDASENYQMTIAPSEIKIAAKSETGLFYGIQTLRQLIRTEGPALPLLLYSADSRCFGSTHQQCGERSGNPAAVRSGKRSLCREWNRCGAPSCRSNRHPLQRRYELL